MRRLFPPRFAAQWSKMSCTHSQISSSAFLLYRSFFLTHVKVISLMVLASNILRAHFLRRLESYFLLKAHHQHNSTHGRANSLALKLGKPSSHIGDKGLLWFLRLGILSPAEARIPYLRASRRNISWPRVCVYSFGGVVDIPDTHIAIATQ